MGVWSLALSQVLSHVLSWVRLGWPMARGAAPAADGMAVRIWLPGCLGFRVGCPVTGRPHTEGAGMPGRRWATRLTGRWAIQPRPVSSAITLPAAVAVCGAVVLMTTRGARGGTHASGRLLATESIAGQSEVATLLSNFPLSRGYSRSALHLITFDPQPDSSAALGVSGMVTWYSQSKPCVTPCQHSVCPIRHRSSTPLPAETQTTLPLRR